MCAANLSQRGVALITALLVVALATIAAVAMTHRQQIDIRRTQNLMETEQLRFYLHGIEEWAGKVLEQDRKDNDVDHMGEAWATTLPPIALESGQLSAHIEDVQGRFNLNNLLDAGKINAVELDRLRNLLAALELSPALADAIVDWLDENPEPWPPHGAEDDHYLNLALPYRAGNQSLAAISELRLIAGVDVAIYRKLSPHVAALPAPTTINLNTATSAIIMALADGVSRDEAERFVEERRQHPYATLQDALLDPIFDNRKIEKRGLGVTSDYFVIMSALSIGRLQQRHASLLARDKTGITALLTRSQLYF